MPTLISNLVPLLLFLAAAAICFVAGWSCRAASERRLTPPAFIPPPADGDDPAQHEAAYKGATTGPHRVQRTSFGYPAHTMPGIRSMRPVAGRRGPQVVTSKRPNTYLDDAPPFAPHLIPSPAEATQVMPKAKHAGGQR